MRHFLLSDPVTALPFGVGVTAAQAGLIAAAGRTQGVPAGLLGAPLRAVALTSITVATDQYGGTAAGAQVASSGKVHWRYGPMGWVPETPAS